VACADRTENTFQHHLGLSPLEEQFLRECCLNLRIYHDLISLLSDAHGSSLKHVSSLSDQIVGLEVIHPDGSIHSITDSGLLNHYRVSLGSLGVITSVTFSVVPMFKVHWSTSSHPESVLTDGRFLV
jgi:hypothetical protein